MRKTTEEFIKEAREIHGDKYDYSKVEYKGDSVKVCIICPEHGEFWQVPNSHLKGCGCPSCSKVKHLTTEEFIKRSKEIHSNRYDYSKTRYINIRTKVTITCPIHGDFEQNPKKHYLGQGCPQCGKKYAKEYKKGDYKHFIDESIARFGDVFEFPNIESEYENSHSKITIRCKSCGNEFVKIACDHITSTTGGCQKCHPLTSNGELELYGFCSDKIGNDNIIHGDRKILNGRELDIFIPSLSMAIEYDGLYWHSEKNGKDKNYHLQKLEMCKTKNIKLLHIFEDEFIFKKDIVLAKITHLMHMDNNLSKIMGRKCVVRQITYEESLKFLDLYHIQGGVKASIYLGAYYNKELIAVMTFKKENDKKWELTRFSSNFKYICQGIGGKMFKYFVRNYNPYEVKSFADRRWTVDETNNIYIQLGFKFEKYIRPDYKYIVNGKRLHKFNFRKQILHKKYGFPLTMTETEMANELGYDRVWDCGLIKYVWKKIEPYGS